MALLLVATGALSSCGSHTLLPSRTILHGVKSFKRPQLAAANDKNFNVWFVKSGPKSLQLISVPRKSIGSDKLEQAVKELLEGPSAAEEKNGLGTEIPRGTILIAIKKDGKNVTLNLSRRFAMTGGTTSFETRLEQLRRTVAHLAGPSDVYLDVEGKRLNIEEGEGIEVAQPINRVASVSTGAN